MTAEHLRVGEHAKIGNEVAGAVREQRQRLRRLHRLGGSERAKHRGQRAAHVERGQRGTDGLFVNGEWQGGHHRNHLLSRRVMRQLQFLSDRRSDRNVDL
jgi:hypothetical protein